jgi:hypothetical protein
MHSDFISGRVTREPSFWHSLYFLWCMAQRSLYTVTKVNSRSYVLFCHRFPLVGYNTIPLGPFCSRYGFPLLHITKYHQAPLAPYGLVGITILAPHIQQDNSPEPT